MYYHTVNTNSAENSDYFNFSDNDLHVLEIIQEAEMAEKNNDLNKATSLIDSINSVNIDDKLLLHRTNLIKNYYSALNDFYQLKIDCPNYSDEIFGLGIGGPGRELHEFIDLNLYDKYCKDYLSEYQYSRYTKLKNSMDTYMDKREIFIKLYLALKCSETYESNIATLNANGNKFIPFYIEEKYQKYYDSFKNSINFYKKLFNEDYSEDLQYKYNNILLNIKKGVDFFSQLPSPSSDTVFPAGYIKEQI